jgi:hypothetical protein
MSGETQQREAKQAELLELRQRAAHLEAELDAADQPRWRATGYYGAYFATTGFMLGIFGAAASLLLNVVGSTLVGRHPLELIRIYLTFPLGNKALTLGLEDGLVLTIGCCLYLGTGMLLGIVFQMVLARLASNGKPRSLASRLYTASALSLAIWVLSYYGILSWLQPLLFGGDWIVRLVPWYIGALTHLVYGWTMALVFPLGLYTPYRLPTESA